MAKYHVNPNTGTPSLCTATTRPCPHGGAEAHGSTPAEAVQAFERSFSSVPQASVKPRTDELSKMKAAQQELREAEAGWRAGKRTDPDWDAKWQRYRDALAAEKAAVDELEDRGLGHLIPDNGPTLRVANKAQKILFEDELSGQISDGKWENLDLRDWQNGGQGHWEIWTSAKVIVDPHNVGRNFRAAKDNYQLNAKDLLDVVGDRMVESVQQGGDPSYNEAKMQRDLRDLRKIFKTARNDHDGSAPAPAAAPTPAPTATPKTSGVPTKPVARKPASPAPARSAGSKDSTDQKARVAESLAGKGRQLREDTYYGLHAGMANPLTGDGDDYDHVAKGGVVIVGKADGSRARVMAGSGEFMDDPEGQMGRRIFLVKQRHNGPDATTADLHVLGYRDTNGNTYGWVPDKKIQYFVFK